MQAASPVSWRREQSVAIMTIDHPPVNALAYPVRTGLIAALHRIAADPAIEAIVLACAGRTFAVGADIVELGLPIRPPSVADLVAAIDASSKPIVAALHGTALGGGFEVALACHHRVAAETARVGLPEIHLGIIPGAGGTQRVPRLIGARAALEMLISGRQIDAREAMKAGLVDEVVRCADLIEAARLVAKRAPSQPLRCAQDRNDWTIADRQTPDLFEGYDTRDISPRVSPDAFRAMVEAVSCAVTMSFEDGSLIERELCEQLIKSPEAMKLQTQFLAKRMSRGKPWASQ